MRTQVPKVREQKDSQTSKTTLLTVREEIIVFIKLLCNLTYNRVSLLNFNKLLNLLYFLT